MESKDPNTAQLYRENYATKRAIEIFALRTLLGYLRESRYKKRGRSILYRILDKIKKYDEKEKEFQNYIINIVKYLNEKVIGYLKEEFKKELERGRIVFKLCRDYSILPCEEIQEYKVKNYLEKIYSKLKQKCQ